MIQSEAKCLSLNIWVFVYRHWCEENEMVFVSHEVPFPATSDRRSRVAGNGTECEVKTIELSSPTSGGEQWAFLNFIIFIAVKKTVPKLRKRYFQNKFKTFEHLLAKLIQFLPYVFKKLHSRWMIHFSKLTHWKFKIIRINCNEYRILLMKLNSIH